LNLKCDILVSKFAFKWVNLYRYNKLYSGLPLFKPYYYSDVGYSVWLCTS
jgi:hypothetical protein